MSFTNVFGGTPISPAQPSFEAIALSSNLQLYWPLELVEGNPYLASQINVAATTSGLTLTMPNALQGSLGPATFISNTGTPPITLLDYSGAQITVLNSSVTWLISLLANTTAAGVWGAIQLGATVSTGIASQLAGAGLTALGSKLNATELTSYLSTNTLITNAYQDYLVVWTGGAGTLTLDTAANLTNGFRVDVINNGTGALTIATSASQHINGQPTLSLAPPTNISNGDNGSIVCDGATFNTAALSVTANETHLPTHIVATNNYTTTTSDFYILVQSSVPTTIILLTGAPAGQTVVVKDSLGVAATNNITISGGGTTIDGAASLVLAVNYRAVTLVFDGTVWSVV